VEYESRRQTIRLRVSPLFSCLEYRPWDAGLLLFDCLTSLNCTVAKAVKDREIIELGSGLGLTGIATGATTKRTWLTDKDGAILDNIRHNLRMNGVPANVQTGVVDFTKPLRKQLKNLGCEPQVLLAADVSYDSELAHALVESLTELLESGEKTSVDLQFALFGC